MFNRQNNREVHTWVEERLSAYVDGQLAALDRARDALVHRVDRSGFDPAVWWRERAWDARGSATGGINRAGAATNGERPGEQVDRAPGNSADRRANADFGSRGRRARNAG